MVNGLQVFKIVLLQELWLSAQNFKNEKILDKWLHPKNPKPLKTKDPDLAFLIIGTINDCSTVTLSITRVIWVPMDKDGQNLNQLTGRHCTLSEQS